jgi:hypothetical protein
MAGAGRGSGSVVRTAAAGGNANCGEVSEGMLLLMLCSSLYLVVSCLCEFCE